jgi:L-fuconolactonase
MASRIDAHHHLWRYTPDEYAWITDDLAALRRDFLLPDLAREMQAARVDAAIAVQARTTVEETRWLLSLAAQPASPIAGVVGWLPLDSPALPDLLAEFRYAAHLKGLRHIVQAEPPGFLDRPDFNAGIARLLSTTLVYDILIYARQLAETIRFVDRHPAQSFVLDHIAKPSIASGEIAEWSKNLRELARRPHVSCKLSGMITEADPRNWTPTQLKPYFEVALEAFTPNRLMIGTDWPVCTLGIAYAEWWQLVESWLTPLTQTERDQILGQTATRIYHLS